MKSPWNDPFGRHFFGLWLADRHDKKRGLTARIAARWGWLKPQGEQGKVIWVLAGNTLESVHQAVQITAAIRAKRLDIRLVMTFERDFPERLAPLDECDKTGWGYAPCDHKRALSRAMQRLNPYGFIVVGTAVRQNLQTILNQHPRVLVTHPQSTSIQHQTVGQGADLQTLLTQAQVDPNFKTLVNQGQERHLWWWHQPSAQDSVLITQWLAETQHDVLFISGDQPNIPHLTMSTWNRLSMTDRQVVWVDDEKWLPAVSVSVTASHFSQANKHLMWQAMAGGAAITCTENCFPTSSHNFPAKLRDAFQITISPIALWRDWRDNSISARQAGDRARRLFWQERRQAETDSHALIERVFEW